MAETSGSSRRSGSDEPRTIGDLRRRLAELGDPWTVDPRLNDDDPLLDRPRGAEVTGPADQADGFGESGEVRVLASPDEVRQLLAEAAAPPNVLQESTWQEAGIGDRRPATGSQPS